MKSLRAIPRALLWLIILESAFAIHEYGHLREFQSQNIPVREFSLGVGPSIYQHQTSSFVINFRLIPIMAYVVPTKEGADLFEKQRSLLEKITVDTGGYEIIF